MNLPSSRIVRTYDSYKIVAAAREALAELSVPLPEHRPKLEKLAIAIGNEIHVKALHSFDEGFWRAAACACNQQSCMATVDLYFWASGLARVATELSVVHIDEIASAAIKNEKECVERMRQICRGLSLISFRPANG